MSFYQFEQLRRSFLQQDGLPFANLLPEQTITEVANDAGISCDADDTNLIYTLPVTLWAFLSQVLFQKAQRSCAAAVARVITLCVALGRSPCSGDTGTYCRARARLPLLLIQHLTTHVAQASEAQLPENWLWRNRHVHLVDGTTVSMPDTASLQQTYPQPSSQKPGLGFPLMRLVVLISFATAMVEGLAQGPYTGKETGEGALFRQLLTQLKAGDVVLADRYFCSYFMIALLRAQGVDCVFRLHQRRHTDFRRGRRLGKGDHVVVWERPPRPEWMSEAAYAEMPVTLEMREVAVRVEQPGSRVRKLTVVTTLTDAATYTSADITELYHKRWLVELDIRTLKDTLGLEVLRCKSVELVTKELWVSMLAYNLIRQTMLQTALKYKLSPRQLSFTAALQVIAASWEIILCCSEECAQTLIDAHQLSLSKQRVGDRGGRVEPRAVKRRPKSQKLLKQPRKEARAKLVGDTGSQ